MVLVPVPLEKVKPNQINTPKYIDKPNYDDAGVSFKTFSQTLLGGNQYRLNPQERLDFNSYVIAIGGEFSFSFARANKSVKNFYCEEIVLSGFTTGILAQGAWLSVFDGGNLRLRIHEPRNAAGSNWILKFKFNTPVLFGKDNNIIIHFNQVRVANDELIVNFFGFEE